MLKGRTTIVVEEEFLIALDLQRMLEGLGAGQTLFARTPAEARQLISNWPDLALAVVEARMGNPATMTLIDALVAAKVPVLLTTGDLGTRQKLANRDGVTVVIKPVSEEDFAGVVARVLTNHT